MGVHFFNVFKLANLANAELHIPVSAVHPSLAMHISLFCLLQGYQKHQKTKKWRIHVRYQNIAKTLKNQKTPKKKRENLCISKTSKNQKNKKGRTYVKPKNPKKKQNGRTYVPVSGMGSTLLFFCFFQVKPKNQKKTKWQNLCPSVWHGVTTFVFLIF